MMISWDCINYWYCGSVFVLPFHKCITNFWLLGTTRSSLFSLALQPIYATPLWLLVYFTSHKSKLNLRSERDLKEVACTLQTAANKPTSNRQPPQSLSPHSTPLLRSNCMTLCHICGAEIEVETGEQTDSSMQLQRVLLLCTSAVVWVMVWYWHIPSPQAGWLQHHTKCRTCQSF